MNAPGRLLLLVSVGVFGIFSVVSSIYGAKWIKGSTPTRSRFNRNKAKPDLKEQDTNRVYYLILGVVLIGVSIIGLIVLYQQSQP